jgi:hypothetical protein
LGTLTGEALIRMNDKHPHPRLMGCQLLNQCLRR